MPTIAPNPNETAWTLGFGGAAWDGSLVAGFALALSTTLRNDGLAVAFPSGATLDASAWAGGSEAALFSPAVGWDATNGGYAAGVLLLSVPASDTALAPGDYRLQVGVTSSGARSVVFDGTFRVGGTTGSATLRQPYITDADLLLRYDQLGTLSNRGSDVAGYADVLALVSDELDRDIVLRFAPYPGDVRQRQLAADPVVGLDVSVATPTWLNQTTITAALASATLVVEWRAKEILANRAIAYVLERQLSSDGRGGRSTYQQEAAMLRARADEEWHCYRAQLTVPGGPMNTPNALVFRGAVILPAGTKP